MKQLIPALFVVGAVMLLIGAAVYVTGWQLSPYIYTVGATFVALIRIGAYCKAGLLARFHRSDVSFINVHLQLEIFKIGRKL